MKWRRAPYVMPVLVAALLLARSWIDNAVATVAPVAPAGNVELFDTRTVSITTTTLWHKVPRSVSIHELLHDHTIWRQMQFGDWDKVPLPIRDLALARMVARYGHLLRGTAAASQLSAFDWDTVPQPIRAFAYQQMVAFWTSHYDVGAGYAESPDVAAQIVSAIVMAESWFEHRGIHVNTRGNRDVGLAACSDHCREVLAELADDGMVDFRFDEHELFDPWNGSRVAAFWFGRELQRAGGDFDLAIAAYHTGMDAARRGAGADYRANVKRLLVRYIRGKGTSPTWAYVMDAVRAAEQRPVVVLPALSSS